MKFFIALLLMWFVYYNWFYTTHAKQTVEIKEILIKEREGKSAKGLTQAMETIMSRAITKSTPPPMIASSETPESALAQIPAIADPHQRAAEIQKALNRPDIKENDQLRLSCWAMANQLLTESPNAAEEIRSMVRQDLLSSSSHQNESLIFAFNLFTFTDASHYEVALFASEALRVQGDEYVQNSIVQKIAQDYPDQLHLFKNEPAYQRLFSMK